jgi:hypothetical protein
MHPTGCGYARLAAEAMKGLGLAHDPQALLERGFGEDALLSRYPPELDVLVRLLGILRDVQHLNHFVRERQTFLTDELHLADALQLMRSSFLP